tara:strand:+ start:469 stop:4251 length:3783 start_codon:yes stop_codon:yes gene_type:complete
MSNEDLPSINDIVEENNLPSYKDFIEEKELPSVEDYISESPKEEVLVEEIENINPVLAETAPEWSELVRLVNDLRKEIPEIPEIKYYDEELSDLSSKLTHIEEYFTQFDQKSNKIDDLDVRNEHFEEKLTEIESKIPEIPTIRYYDHDIEHINDRITQLKEDITSLPEIKHYDSDISSLIEELNKVKSRDVPDFRWIGNTFNTIDEDFTRVQGHLDVIKEKISFEVSELNETIQVKDFEQNINVKNLKDTVNDKIDQTNTRLTETKDKIYSELSKSSLKVWEYHREFKDDDRKLKKAVLSEQNKIKQKLEKEITSINEQSIKTDETLLKFFNELKEQVNLLPEVKYYDNEISTIVKDIDSLKTTVRELKDIASLIKKDQKQLQENYLLNEPPSEKETAGNQTDVLTPLNQKFATLDDLSNHYRLFINRITTQLSTMGGGGAGYIKDLDDVDFSGITTGSLLIYEASTSKWVGIASTALGGGGDADSASKLVLDVRNNNIGYALTIGTPVYQTAYNSGLDRLGVEESRASNSVTMPAKGVVSTDLANNTSGQIIVYGELEGVNTSAFEVADELYVAPGGGLTNVRPTDPTHLVQKIAVVLKKSTANGAILVYGAGRTNDVPNNISIAGSVTAVDGFFSGNLSVGGTITKEDIKNLDSIGIITARSGITVTSNGLNVSGVSTISTGVGTVHIGVGQTTLLVDGDARVTGILTVGRGSITLDPTKKSLTGIDDIVVGSGASISLAPFFGSSGKFVIDYSTINLKGYGSDLDGAYNRQSTSFVLTGAPSYSGSATFSNISGYYYFLHESDNSKIIIYNLVDGYWSAIYSNGSNFSSPSNGQSLGSITQSRFINPIRASFDGTGRVYPAAVAGIEYETTITGRSSLIGIATATSLDVEGNTKVTGIITAASFFGDGSGLSNIISGVGIQSTSTRIGTGYTDINFTGAGVTVVGSGTTITIDVPIASITRQVETSSGITTVFTITGGYTVGMIDVFLNGTKQVGGVDFTATNGSVVTMTPFINDGDVVEFQKIDQIRIAGITSTTNATNAYNIVGGVGYASSAGIATALNSDSSVNTSGIITAASFVGDGSGLTGVASTDNITTSGIVTVTSTDAGSSAGPIIELYRNSASPDNGDYLGQIKFQGENDSGGKINYAKITGKISDVDNTSEDGIIEIAHIKAGSQNISARFKSTELMLLNGTDLSVAGDSTFTGDVTANGNIVGDNSTNISGINSVTATTFYGDGSNLTNAGASAAKSAAIASFLGR